MPSRNLNRALWAAVLVLLAILAVTTRDKMEEMFVGVGKLDVRVAPETGTLYLSWRGKIDAPMASRIEAAFEAHRAQVRTVVLSLSSPGGSLDQGAKVARILRRIGETHSLETIVDARRVCASMCVPVYLQGQRRIAAANARFMFHEVSFRDYFSQDESDVPVTAKASATDRLFSTYFTPAGVSQSWISTVREEMSGGTDVWKTARMLMDENAGIVQQTF